jgi:hypothetical protein
MRYTHYLMMRILSKKLPSSFARKKPSLGITVHMLKHFVSEFDRPDTFR